LRTKRTATLASKYQISIPKRVREAFGWKPGTEFAFIRKGKPIVLVPEFDDLVDMFHGADPSNYRERPDSD
jgi:AbrB family looped-hinge helix DNA binding protein